jgi:hypothetical protein
MKTISFAIYYIKLRAGVFLGPHLTANPVDLRWRRRYRNERRRRRKIKP